MALSEVGLEAGLEVESVGESVDELEGESEASAVHRPDNRARERCAKIRRCNDAGSCSPALTEALDIWLALDSCLAR